MSHLPEHPLKEQAITLIARFLRRQDAMDAWEAEQLTRAVLHLRHRAYAAAIDAIRLANVPLERRHVAEMLRIARATQGFDVPDRLVFRTLFNEVLRELDESPLS